MVNDNIVKLVIDNVDIEGLIIYRSSRGINIQITKPFINVEKSCHIPYFSAPYNSFIGEYGDKMAETLLKECYTYASCLFNNLEELRESWKIHNSILNSWTNILMTDENFKIEKSNLKKKLKNKELEEKQYQREYNKLHKHRTAYERIMFLSHNAFFSRYSFLTSCIDKNTLDILNRKIEITKGQQND